MIIVQVGEPRSKKVGDIWFDPTTKITQKAQLITSGLVPTPVLVFRPSSWFSQPLPNPTVGDVYVDRNTGVPNLYDGTSWIPAVPANYKFPNPNPQVGDIWTEPLSQILYVYWNGTWSSSLTSNIVNANPPVNVAAAPHVTSFTPNSNVHTITIQGPNGDVLVIIDSATGTIKYGPNYTPDVAAQIFWRAITGSSPRFLETRIEELIKDLKNVSSRLAVAEGNVLKFTEAGYKLPEPPKPFDPNDSWERAMGIIK